MKGKVHMKNEKTREIKNIDMLNGPLGKNIFLFAMPIVASGFLQLLFNAADLVVVGRYGQPNSIGAVGATAALATLIVNLFMGLSIGVGVEVSRGLGENNWVKVNRAVHTCIPLALVSGAIVAVVGVLLARPALELIGTPDDIIERSTLYLRIFYCGVPANLVYNYGSAVLRADGDSRRPLIYLTIAGVLNVILNLFFVIVMKLDVAGVALATALTTILSATLTVRALTRLEDVCRLQFKYMKFYREPLIHILKVGVPAGIQNATFSISNVVLQSGVNSFGTLTIDANSAAQSLQGFSFMVLNGFSQACVNFAGQNYGARQFGRITKTKNTCFLYEFACSVVLTSVVILWGRNLSSLYLNDDVEAIEIAQLRLLFTVSMGFVNSWVETYSGCLRGMGYSTVPMFVSLIGICGTRLLILFTLFETPKFHTYLTICAVNPFSWIVTFIIASVVYAVVSKKKFAERSLA